MKIDIDTALSTARAADNGRHAELLVTDGPLRQTLIGLTSGTVLQEHNSPPAASIQVLAGVVVVTAGDTEFVFQTGDITALTHERHSVAVSEDAVFLLTTVTSQPGMGSHGD